MGEEKKRAIERLESLLKLIREALLLGLLATLIWQGWPLLSQVRQAIPSAHLKSLDLGPLKFEIKAAEAKLEQAVVAAAPKSGKEDERVGKATQEALDALDSVRRLNALVSERLSETAPMTLPSATPSASPSPPPAASFWVYLGAKRRDQWVTRYFDVGAGVPAAGSTVQARSDVFRRAAAPSVEGGDWVLGQPVGVLKAGSSVTIVATESVPGTGERTLWWAEVTVPSPRTPLP